MSERGKRPAGEVPVARRRIGAKEHHRWDRRAVTDATYDLVQIEELGGELRATMAIKPLFGVPWDRLGTDQVRQFLDSAGDEPFTWEGKAGHIRPQHVRRIASAFGNSRYGGFLILGADRPSRDGPWRLAGAEIPHAEPMLWVDSVIRDGVDPMPPFDVRPLEADNPSLAAVIVQFDPVARPPCITTDGEVYERAAGASRPVRDAASLERLFARGEAAGSSAYDRTHQAVAHASHLRSAHYERRLVVGLAPLEVAPNLRYRIFRSGGSTALRRQLHTHLRPLGSYSLQDGHAVQQHSTVVSLEDPRDRQATWLYAAESGAVAVGWSSSETIRAHVIFDEGRLAGAWNAAAAAIADLGGRGPGYLYSAMTDISGDIGVELWIEELEPNDDLLAGIRRQIRRAQGDVAAVEPKPLG